MWLWHQLSFFVRLMSSPYCRLSLGFANFWSAVVQALGGAFGVPAAQAAFQNTLLKQLSVTAPQVDRFTILNAGATGLKNIVPAESMEGVLEAYVAGFRETLILAIAFGGAAFITAFSFRSTSIQKIRLAESQI